MSEAAEINKVREHIMDYQTRKQAFYQKIADRATLGIPDSYLFSFWQVTVFEGKVHDDFSIEGLEAKMDEYKLQRHNLLQIHRTLAFGWYVMFGAKSVAIGSPNRVRFAPYEVYPENELVIRDMLSKQVDRWIVVPKKPKLVARILVEGR